PELKDTISRFRFTQSCVGLSGCLCVSYAVWTPFWLKDGGLWTEWNDAERVFGVLSFLLALSAGALSLVFALCWTSETVRSYSNTRALLMAGQALYPTTLLLLTMSSTFFFLLSWSFFTYHHSEEIYQDFSILGSSYWLGALGWILLLVVETIIFVAEQAIVPDILEDLEKALKSWRVNSRLNRSFSDGCPHLAISKSKIAPKRYMSVP
uniref:Si:ch211-256a21.4 n=1 Tax=Hippocampus comes TaxID=109280 RepID=A0A3Q2XU44_HIPCM